MFIMVHMYYSKQDNMWWHLITPPSESHGKYPYSCPHPHPHPHHNLSTLISLRRSLLKPLQTLMHQDGKLLDFECIHFCGGALYVDFITRWGHNTTSEIIIVTAMSDYKMTIIFIIGASSFLGSFRVPYYISPLLFMWYLSFRSITFEVKMIEKKQKKFLTVPPFECAWLDGSKFKEAGRGCITFDAFAHNDVTIVFREQVGSQHYHYKRDRCPNYTVIIGSHRNRRFRIEVNGSTVVDEASVVGLLCSSAFQSYWISVYDGLISIGTGRYPFQNLCFQWLDSKPNCNVQYVGLSSWDKHVGYRNVNVLPLTQNHITLWKQVDWVDEYKEEEVNDERVVGNDEIKDDYTSCGLGYFLESWDLSDIFFIAGKEEKAVPAHKVILAAAGNFFNFTSTDETIIPLPNVNYQVLHALLQYIYAGHTQIPESHLSSLKALSLQFEVIPLVKQCEEILELFKLNNKLFDSGKNVEISCPSSRQPGNRSLLSGLPIDVGRLKQFCSSGLYSDVELCVEGYNVVAKLHKVILSLWSFSFMKMFTNGMRESNSSRIYMKDVSFEAFQIMVEFMYTGELSKDIFLDEDTSLLQLLLLADQHGVTLLHQECCKTLLESLSEDSVCHILQVISCIPSCKLVEETCERKFSMHFDYCTTASTDFVMLDEATFSNILQHQELTVTSEERILNAILLWGMQSSELYGWERVDEMLVNLAPELLFKERLNSLNEFLPFVRFPLLSYEFLIKLERSNLNNLPSFSYLVNEAITYVKCGFDSVQKDQNVRFQHRRSSFKELQYICDGDSNGVLYFAGTSYGQHQWVNPVLSKRITIAASSPTSRYTDPKVLSSRTYQGTSFAGTRMEDGLKSAWWMVDVGHDHQLMCNYYTIRQDGSRSFMRSWNLQGSMDWKNWTKLRIHENDQTLCKPGQFSSWPVIGPNALLPFRYFRVIVTAPTADDNNPWSCCICFLELYGYFR